MKWYQNNFKLFFAILLIAPLGIFGLIKRQTSKNTFKIISLVLSVIYGVFYGIFLIGIIASLVIGADKIHFDNGITNKKKSNFEQAIKDFTLIDEKCEYYNKAQSEISKIKFSIDSIKQVEKQKIAEQNKKLAEIENQKKVWCDSIVKSWNGQFITDYKKPINGDTLYFYLSKNASKSFNSNRESNLPMYLNSYKASMKHKFGNNFTDKTVIEFIQDEQTKKELIEKSQRRDIIMRQFGFNQQHRNLEREIKRMMNDPDSYEHIETNWEDKGSYILLETSIRGTNPYSAKIVKTYRAKATIDGQILEIK